LRGRPFRESVVATSGRAHYPVTNEALRAAEQWPSTRKNQKTENSSRPPRTRRVTRGAPVVRGGLAAADVENHLPAFPHQRTIIMGKLRKVGGGQRSLITEIFYLSKLQSLLSLTRKSEDASRRNPSPKMCVQPAVDFFSALSEPSTELAVSKDADESEGASASRLATASILDLRIGQLGTGGMKARLERVIRRRRLQRSPLE